MDDYYERLNQAFANWNGGEPSLDDRVAALESEMLQKQDILTFDSEPVEDSKNPVTSGGLFSHFERYATKTDLDDKVGTATFTADRDRQETEIGAVANAGAKNLLSDKNPIGSTVEKNGFRFTPQFDGGIKIESIGAHSANGDYYIQGKWGNTETILDLSDNTYAATISCETDARIVSLRIFGANNTPIVNNIYNNDEVNFTGEVKFIFITVLSTSEIPSGGVIVYPMIRPASITDSTYVPYAPTNRELYEMILALQSGS